MSAKILTHSNSKIVWSVAVALAIDLIIFAGTDASKVPSFVIMVGFLALVLTFGVFWYGFFSFLGIYGIRLRNKARFAAYTSMLCAAFIALQSIGELSKRDIVVLLPLVALGYLYSVYSRSDRSNFDP